MKAPTKSKPSATVEACALLLDAIQSADSGARLEWDRKVIRAFDITPKDFILGLRSIVDNER